MTRHGNLLDALNKRLPGATIHIAECCNWCSAGFVGERLTIIADVGRTMDVQCFTTDLPKHEFSLPGAIVADIAMVDTRNIAGCNRLRIEVLLIDE